jgi:hypothetical protein
MSRLDHQPHNMQSKVSVILVKSKTIDTSSDINKMAVHLEQILTEKDKTDIKVRQSVTEAIIKTADYMVFCGYDSGLLAEFFKALSVVEEAEPEMGPQLFLYEEPGQSIWEHLNSILMEGVGLGRVDPKIFNRVVTTWSYRDIVQTINIKLRTIEVKLQIE